MNARIALVSCASVKKGIGWPFPLPPPVIPMIAPLRNDLASAVFSLNFLVTSASLYFLVMGKFCKVAEHPGVAFSALAIGIERMDSRNS